MKTSQGIRRTFLNFFKDRGHTIVPSGSVIPGDDPTLIFTNAGMNQFKDVFLGSGSRPYTRVADTQKCIRVSGKHNDLEEVGRDTYHHTFFEMLGNWSFGDYYKKDAISWAWELLTTVWGLPKERLWATVYKDDDEAEQLWRGVTDIDPSHILRFGEKDNFWEMGETGPCGPCSEIHIDRTPDGSATAAMVNAGIPEVMEIWNLVFIQYNRDEKGKLNPLPSKHVDTGMGFERICAVLQEKDSNYDTDVFLPLILQVAELSGRPYDGRMDATLSKEHAEYDVAMRVIADHVRTLAFAIADGAIPSNEGRGYVLRRILRRAARFGRKLGLREPFLFSLVHTLESSMGDVFPELKARQEHIERVIRGEEENFNATLDRGLEVFEQIVVRTTSAKSDRISGEDAFRLYDTFGFPVDLTSLMAAEQKLAVDEPGFTALLDQQKERSREAHKGHGAASIKFVSPGPERVDTEFVGYTSLEIETEVRSSADSFVTLARTPFYAESGGQIGDTGTISAGGRTLKIIDTQKDGKVFGHRCEGDLKDLVGKPVLAKVDAERREAIARNHTATHLVHEALRRVLGEHLHQQGSLVADTHLRFDFNHFEKITHEHLASIEEIVNAKINEGIPVRAINDPKEWVTIEEAKKRWPKVKMFFGEKYGDRVRVVEIDPTFSVELCGGTHVLNSKEIGFFRFRSEGSVASGIRRIDAVTGTGALELFKVKDYDLHQKIDAAGSAIQDLLHVLERVEATSGVPSTVSRTDLLSYTDRLEKVRRSTLIPATADQRLRESFNIQHALAEEVERIIVHTAEVRKQLDKADERLRSHEMARGMDDMVSSAPQVNGFRVVALQVSAASQDELKTAGDALRAKLGSGVGLLAAVIEDKVQLVCVVTDDLINGKNLKAGVIVGAVAKLLGGGGGGRPHMATAGGKNVAGLPDVLKHVPDIVQQMK